MTKAKNFIQLTNDEPIYLKVNALTDFLWSDFVRDRNPLVEYIAEVHNIKQISRLGKELFDFLYKGGDVDTLFDVSEYESYRTALEDEEQPKLPAGYKPENSFWVQLFISIIESPWWEELKVMTGGDQILSGNTAINITNNIAEEINENSKQLKNIQQLADDLETTRETFKEAIAKGGGHKAAEIKRQGKELGQQLEKLAIKTNQTMIKPVQKIVKKAKQQADQVKKGLEAFGDQAGLGHLGDDLEQKKDLANLLSKNKNLMLVIDRLGALKRAWSIRKRSVKYGANYDETVGAKFSDEVTKVFPIELALAATQGGKALFALKLQQKTLLVKEYEAKIQELEKGPVIMYIDVSGSMLGQRETWAKAIALVVANECMQQHRAIEIHLFDTEIQQSIVLNKDRQTNMELINFIVTWTTRGGTKFGCVLDHAVQKKTIKNKADVLMITDGQSDIPHAFVKRLLREKEEHGFQWTSFCIGDNATDSLEEFSDQVYPVDIENDSDSATFFQKSIR